MHQRFKTLVLTSVFPGHSLTKLLTEPRRTLQNRNPDYEDDRWLEAEMANKEMTAEERYAFQKQRELLNQMKSKIIEKPKKSKFESKQTPVSERTKITKLQLQIKTLKGRIAAMITRKKK